MFIGQTIGVQVLSINLFAARADAHREICWRQGFVDTGLQPGDSIRDGRKPFQRFVPPAWETVETVQTLRGVEHRVETRCE